MAIQKKHGKGRLDKWYKLAKEKGYRARAAFKLIQLNRKYGFLEKSRVLLDLCAAPGSWCQVAAETMPASSLIVGVDLAPIRAIPRVITFQSDITTDKCRATIRQHLKTWKADTVLHDGAPNVGTAWIQDAFSQAELVLQSMKLATEFLIEGGTFVTKVFRSKDYNPLLWVFNQLFEKVEATKPPSSRNVSAEIFVVCRGYKAPKRIDPRLLDPRAVFADLADAAPNNEAKIYNPERKVRKRGGYEDGEYTQFKEAPASEFIQHTDPIAMLASLSKFSFDQRENGDLALATLGQLPETTQEIRDCCADLKVLGRKEFRMLLRWRLKVRQRFGFPSKYQDGKIAQTQETVVVEPLDEETLIEDELKRLRENEDKSHKRERRHENERKQREIVRMQMHMIAPTEIGLEQGGPNGEESLFTPKGFSGLDGVDAIRRGRMAISIRPQAKDEINAAEDSDPGVEEDQLDIELESLYLDYKERKSSADAKHRAKRARMDGEDGEWDGVSPYEDSESEDIIIDKTSNDEQSSDEELQQSSQRISTGTVGTMTRRASQFFEQDLMKGLLGFDETVEYEDDMDREEGGENFWRSKAEILPSEQLRRTESIDRTKDRKGLASIRRGDVAQGLSWREISPDFEDVTHVEREWEDQGEALDASKHMNIDIITAEAMTLAQQLASGEKSTRELMDEGFNKYAFKDRDGLPEWFLDDEGKHSKPHRPISAEAAAAIKEKLRVLNARPIKKVREAKDRKRFKAAQRLEKLRRKSALLAGDEGLSEKDKAQNISKLMSKASKKKPKQQVKVVVARGGNRGISGRPRGVKGKYKIVDPRLKKDVRAEKRLAKKKR
ncbi:AdoMet-dependent rRNA methyltransferase spb1 [Agyrium rufum]|nr:AdoMet-dependent rRNA methyltransferase spb1 [Agyrium rufum]